MLNKEDAKDRIEKLRELIEKYRYAYHVLDKSLVTDAVNDSLKNELQDLEDQYPTLTTPDSPTQRVGGEPLKEFTQVKHKTPMLSLTDAFTKEDTNAWYERIAKFYSKVADSDFYGELKMDGLAVSLVYEKGVFVRGSTRGNGMVGEDVTENLKTIEAIPLKLEYRPDKRLKDYEKAINKALSGTIEVRGEAFMTRSTFKKLNTDQEGKGQKTYANPRNIAAGSIRQLDSKVTASRMLSFYAYSFVTDLGLKTHEEEHLLCSALGVKTNPNCKLLNNFKEVIEYHDHWEKKKDKLDYWFDGVVISINDKQIFERLGSIGKAPRGAVAFKFSPDEATTVVEQINVNVGRTGVLTPVATFKPVKVSGVTVTHATLHNADEIERKDIRVGDTVVIRRAGEVIPEVVRSIKELRSGKEKVFHFPKKCPICDSPVVRKEGEVAYRCTNAKCVVVRVRTINHFVSKDAMDFDGLGPKLVEKLFEKGVIKDIADLFRLKPDDFRELEGMGEILPTKLVNSIQAKTKLPLGRLLYSLGIPHIGNETAELLARRFESIDKLKVAKEEEIAGIEGVGPIVAKSVSEFLGDKENKMILEKLLKYITIEAPVHKIGPLSGKTVVVTGSLGKMTRTYAHEAIRNAGGMVGESVSSKTDYLVVGEEAGSKLDKAKKFGTKLLTEQEFTKLLS